jgi:hypothetical protein
LKHNRIAARRRDEESIWVHQSVDDKCGATPFEPTAWDGTPSGEISPRWFAGEGVRRIGPHLQAIQKVRDISRGIALSRFQHACRVKSLVRKRQLPKDISGGQHHDKSNEERQHDLKDREAPMPADVHVFSSCGSIHVDPRVDKGRMRQCSLCATAWRLRRSTVMTTVAER